MQADKLMETEVSTAYSFTFSPSISSSTEQNKSLVTNTSVSCSTKFEALALRDGWKRPELFSNKSNLCHANKFVQFATDGWRARVRCQK